MSSFGMFEVYLWIKRKKFKHLVNVIDELNENIALQVKFARARANYIVALTKVVRPAMTSTAMKTKFKGNRDAQVTYMANICAPRTPMISGIPSTMAIDENNICNIIVENGADYDVMLEWDNILGIMGIEEEELIPLTDDFISCICQDIHNRFPKVKSKRLSRQDIKKDAISKYKKIQVEICRHSLQAPGYTHHRQIQPGSSQELLAQDPPQNWGFSLPEAIQNPRGKTDSMNKHRINGWNLELSRGLTHSITNPFSVFQRNKANDSGSFKTFVN
jgi:hypothetical protein